MNRRITKQHAKWRQAPRMRGPLTGDEAARALPRILQRLRSRNEAWVIVSESRPLGVACLLSARYYDAVSTGSEPRGTHDVDARRDRGTRSGEG